MYDKTYYMLIDEYKALSSRKDLNIGDYLIDDSNHRGQGLFRGEWIHFGSDRFPNWKTVMDYLKIT